MTFRSSNVVEKSHESEIHVQLLMAMEERKAGIIRYEIHRNFLISSHHYHVLHHARSRRSHDIRQLECMAVQVNRVEIVTGIPHMDTIAAALLQVKSCWLLHGRIRVGDSIDRPAIETFNGRVVLCEEHLECFVGSRRRCTWFCKPRVVPPEFRWRCDPLGFASASRILHDDTHAVLAVIVCCITQNPYSRMIHLDHRGNALCRA